MTRVYGTVADFYGSSIEGATVEIVDRYFAPVDQVLSDRDGRYCLSVPEGLYLALGAIKGEDYATRKLEYWAWNVPVFCDIEINPRYDRLEVYGMDAWWPKYRRGKLRSLQVYFRPMSLHRVHAQGGPDVVKKMAFIDIAPDLTAADIQATIDGKRVPVLEVNKVREASPQGSSSMFGYLISTDLPEARENLDYRRIVLTIEDSLTGEMGEGLLFWQEPAWK